MKDEDTQPKSAGYLAFRSKPDLWRWAKGEGMRPRHIPAIVAALSLAAAGVWAADSAAVTNRTVVLSSLVERVNTKWVGHGMSEIIGKGHPVTIVVLKNVTQAMPQMHVDRMRLVLQSDPILRAKPVEQKGDVWFECLVIMDDGTIIRMERSHDWGRLSTENGQAYFNISDAELLKMKPNQPSATR
jgi:hypothetical protein